MMMMMMSRFILRRHVTNWLSASYFLNVLPRSAVKLLLTRCGRVGRNRERSPSLLAYWRSRLCGILRSMVVIVVHAWPCCVLGSPAPERCESAAAWSSRSIGEYAPPMIRVALVFPRSSPSPSLCVFVGRITCTPAARRSTAIDRSIWSSSGVSLSNGSVLHRGEPFPQSIHRSIGFGIDREEISDYIKRRCPSDSTALS